MADARDPIPSTETLCTFTEPASRDAGRSYSAPIAPGCAGPEGIVADGQAEIIFIDGVAQALEV